MKQMWIALLIFVAVIGLALAGCQATRAGYESAPYKVVRADGKFELRDYPALTVEVEAKAKELAVQQLQQDLNRVVCSGARASGTKGGRNARA